MTSTFTRTTTPPYSANPLQVFATYKQARRAAKGASPVAILTSGLMAISLVPILVSEEFVDLSVTRKAALLVISGTIVVGLACLGWRIWVRPGPWKVAAVLAFLLVDAVAELLRFAVPSLVIVGVTVNFCLIAFRGALAMKRLQGLEMQLDLDVF